VTDPEENLMDDLPEFPYDKTPATANDVATESMKLAGVIGGLAAGGIMAHLEYGTDWDPQRFHRFMTDLDTPSGQVVAEHRSTLALAVESYVGNFISEVLSLSLEKWRGSMGQVLHDAVLEEIGRLRDEGEL
jgi:hypothetical protein